MNFFTEGTATETAVEACVAYALCIIQDGLRFGNYIAQWRISKRSRSGEIVHRIVRIVINRIVVFRRPAGRWEWEGETVSASEFHLHAFLVEVAVGLKTLFPRSNL